MKTVGIITYWDTKNNYGTILQNYALQLFLKKRNIVPFLIRIQFSFKLNRFQLYRCMLKKNGLGNFALHIVFRFFVRLWNIVSRTEKKELSRNFSDFIKDNLNPTTVFHSYSELKEHCPAADFYIAGSDQIWNTYGKAKEEIGDEIRAYLLSFAQTGKMRISCAASFGNSELDPVFLDLFKNELAKFEYISVREQGGINICKKLGFENAFLQPDPTMLLSISEYKGIESKVLVPEKPYVLLYLLGNTTDFSIRSLNSFSMQNNLDVVYVSANEMQRINFYRKVYPTVGEWLGLFDCAKYIVTNSFHGTVFSLIFNKNFLSVPQCGEFQNQNDRARSLLEYFGLSSRIFKKGNLEHIMNPIDWNSVNTKLEKIRKKSPFVAYVESVMNGGVE